MTLMIRAFLTTWVSLSIGIFAFAAGAGLTGSVIAALAMGVLSSVVAAFVIWKILLAKFENDAAPRRLQILSAVAMLLALIQLARLTVFIVEPSATSYSTFPSSKWETQHSCLSAYFVADQAVGKVPDIYDNSLYSIPDDDPTKVRKPRMLGPFKIDVYEYPPPFLLLPRATSIVTSDFYNNRRLWFALNGMISLVAILVVALSLAPLVRTRAMLLCPMIWAALPTINTLQKGNIQLTIVAMAMLGMVLFKLRRFFSGGLLLAYAIASKLFPGMLLVYLLLRRQWRAFWLTAGCGILLALLAFMITGWQTYEAFLAHVPGLLSGEAFPALRNPFPTAINLSIPGLVFKLKLFGVPNMTFGTAKIIGWIYTLIVILVIGFIVRRSHHTGEDGALIWLSILILATLRSPFLPQSYGNVPAIWLLTLVAATYSLKGKMIVILIFAWISLNVMVPIDWGLEPWRLALVNTLPQVVLIAVVVWSLWRWDQTITYRGRNDSIY